MDVSENDGTLKSSILMGISIINHTFWGTPIFGNPHIYIYIFFLRTIKEVVAVPKVELICCTLLKHFLSDVQIRVPWNIVHRISNVGMYSQPYMKQAVILLYHLLGGNDARHEHTHVPVFFFEFVWFSIQVSLVVAFERGGAVVTRFLLAVSSDRNHQRLQPPSTNTRNWYSGSLGKNNKAIPLSMGLVYLPIYTCI